MLVYGISMIRNEADLVRLNVLYHLSLGVDRMLIVDNGSTDGTDGLLKSLSDRDSRVRWFRDDGPFLPSRVMTGLARQAFGEGADWVLPVDADEFWHAPGGDFRRVLETSRAGVLQAEAINFIQWREQRVSEPEALLHMTRRAAAPVGPHGHAQDLVESGEIAFVEKVYPTKCLARPSQEIYIETGHHRIDGVEGTTRRTDELVCLHAPIRSRDALAERIRSSARAAEAGRKQGQGRNRRRLADLNSETAIEREWAANSYEGDHLDINGERHPVVFDPHLRNAVAPFLRQPFWKRVRRFAVRSRGA